MPNASTSVPTGTPSSPDRADSTEPRAARPHVFIGVTLLALSLALFVAWLVVLRPAQRDNATIRPDDLVNSDARPDNVGALAKVGEPAPTFTLKGFDGADITIDSLRGKPTVINFWASSCAPCIKEMPLIERAYLSAGSTVNFVGVDVFESPELGKAMIKTTGVTYPQTVDPTNEVLTTFAGVQLPHTVVLRADGTVSALHNEAITDDQVLHDLIDTASK